MVDMVCVIQRGAVIVVPVGRTVEVGVKWEQMWSLL
jgi:hypothetical protein